MFLGNFWNKKAMQQKRLEFDPSEKVPIIKCSICNGEQVAGLKDVHTGKFEEVMVIRQESDMIAFQEMCGVEEIKKEY